jgi:hypothetical protein
MRPNWRWAVVLAMSSAFIAGARRADAGFGVLPNIKATGIEVTQGIQDLDNNVPLVSGKNAYVRVYAQAEQVLSVIYNVNAVLVGARVAPPNPNVLLGILTPVNPGGQITVRTTPGRINLNDAFLFQLPPSWRTGTVRLFAIIDPGDSISESNETDNTSLRIVDFEPVPPVRVLLHNVDYPGGDLPAEDDYKNFVSWMRNAYPIKDIVVTQRTYISGIDWPNDTCNCTVFGLDGGCLMTGICANDPNRLCSADSTCGCGRLNDILSYLRALDEVFALPGVFQPDTRYVGWVDESGGFMRGCSPGVDRKVASGPTGPKSWGWDDDGSYADWYTGHELGHAYGRPHAPCCSAAGAAFYPYPDCELSDGSSSFLGFDFRTREILFPPKWHDVMSYCDFQWTSDFTYEALRDQLLLEDGAPPPPPGGINDLVMVQGDTDLDLVAASLRDIYVLRDVPTPPPPPPGDYSIQLLDGSVLLASVSFDVRPIFDDADLLPDGIPRGDTVPNRVAPILQAIPLVPGTNRVVLTRLGAELASRTVTPNTPVVKLLSPNGGEVLNGTATVEWMASDIDGGSLTATLLYSADGGASWSAIATQIDTSSVVVDCDSLPGGANSLFRVLVSDGFNTGEDQSDRSFTVGDSPPDVVITSPGNGSVYQGSNIVSLESQANDMEDGSLDGPSVVWSSDRRGVLGTGASLELGGLATGDHWIEVTATDSAANRATDHILLTIDRPIVAVALSPAGMLLAVGVLLLSGWRLRRG